MCAVPVSDPVSNNSSKSKLTEKRDWNYFFAKAHTF